ncbi:MAG: transglycosylase SLT domain-containing protein [Rhizobiaceae bacterium]|nr:transglycosylase SLT domain-containing protein [Rhizobiaceae bacterium]MCV0407835.1 transglycosylase SLT domain-containing protein [Rhizobiaceae bacterium]
MDLSHSIKMFTVVALLGVSACASQPSQINDVCAVFSQRDGWINNWQSAARRAESRHGVPMHILMATVRKESGFNAHARPPRNKLFGVVPWKRKSSAYGYSQALDGTWSEYRRETGNLTARRTNFADAVDFVGWYHRKSSETLGIARDDAYHLYLAYYSGPAGYKRGSWRGNASLQNYARQTAQMADRYATQMQQCANN